MSRRTEITKILTDMLKNQMPNVHWTTRTTGVNRSNRFEGTVSCDRIEYTEMTKTGRKGVMTYYIYLADSESIDGIDLVADELDALLTKYRNLGGWITDSRVKDIVYGMAQGKTTVGMARLTYEVYFDC